MQNRCGAVLVVAALAALSALAVGVPSAGAAVTSSQVTAPASGTFFQQNGDTSSDPAHQITISGTVVGTGNVDLFCTFGGAGSDVIALDVPVNPSGSFSFTGPAPDPERPCVVRALPQGGGVPQNLSPFTGPTIAAGDFDTSAVSGGPNNGLLYDFFDNDAQFSGDADYVSVGRGGVFDTYPVDPSTLNRGADLFFSDGYLSDANGDRSDLQVDGFPAYASFTAENLLGFTGADFPGLPAVTFTQSQNPATGDVTVHESELLVQCAPAPATYPPGTSSCTSFRSTGVRFNRTIVQSQDGRQAHVTDTYTSIDGQPHALDLRYGQDFNESTAGFDFPWVDGSAYHTHTAGDTEPPPPNAPTSMFVDADNTLADGSQSSAQGAITFAERPNGFAFVPEGRFGNTHLDVSYTRTIPASGSVTLKTAYSWAFTIADAHRLAALAEQSFTPLGSLPDVITGTAAGITPNSAVVSGLVNPNGQVTTYHFDYGTSTGYGHSTPSSGAGSGTTANAVSAILTGLQADTTYHFRLVATSASGTTSGTDATFHTGSLSTPPTTRLSVGRVKVKASTASVRLSCTGASGAVCRGTLTETIKVKKHHKRVTQTVAMKSFSIRAGRDRTAQLTLNKKGRKALATSPLHKLKATLTVRLGANKVATRTVTFKQHEHKHKK